MATQKYMQLHVPPTQIADTLNTQFDLGWKLVIILPPCDAGPTGSVTIVFEKIK